MRPYDWQQDAGYVSPAPLDRATARLLGPILTVLPHNVPKDYEALHQVCIEDHHRWYADKMLRYFGDVQEALDSLVALGLIRYDDDACEYRLVYAPETRASRWPDPDQEGTVTV